MKITTEARRGKGEREREEEKTGKPENERARKEEGDREILISSVSAYLMSCSAFACGEGCQYEGDS